MTRTLCVVVAVIGLTSIVALGQAKPDPKILMGTWKLNVEKSKFTPGPAPKTTTLTWKPTPTGFSLTIDGVNAEGQTMQLQQNGTFDGTPYAVKFANFNSMQTTKWVDAFTLTEVNTLDGKVRTSRTIVISNDGKTLTSMSKGVDAQGQPTSNTTVYEKQ